MAKTQGEIWPMDRFGRARNAADKSRLTPLARRVSRAIAEAYRTRLGDDIHSVYLTGPAARGRPGAIEAIGVMRMTAAPIGGRSWLEETAGAIRARWPAAGRPELALLAWRELFPEADAFSPERFRIAVNSLCLSGRDLSRRLAPQRLSVAAANAWIVGARERITSSSDRVGLEAREDDVRRESRALGRLLLATGFALVMPHEGVYTEDPDLQRDFIALNFPERSDDVARAYDLMTAPSDQPADVLSLLDGCGRWLLAECDKWLDRHNPHRVAALPA